jgi:hypothetical protein
MQSDRFIEDFLILAVIDGQVDLANERLNGELIKGR